jgi:WD40 repeat protein
MSRRSAIGWILGGAAVVAVAGGAGFFFYSKLHIPDHALSVLQGHSDAVTSVAWSPDGSQMASGSRDKTARLWQISSGQTVATYKGHTAAIMSVAWRPRINDVQLLASGGDDETVQVWNAQAARRRSFPRLGAPVSSVLWSLDGSYILAGTLGNGTHALPLSGGTPTRSLVRLDIHALAFSPDGSYIAAATESGSVAVVTVQAPHKVVFSRSLTSAALSVAWSPDGTKLAAGFANNTAEVYTFSPGTLSNGHILRALPHNGAVHSVAWEPASTTTSTTPRLATASDDGTLNIWDIASAAQTIYNGYGPAMLSVSWSGGGLATGDANNTVILWQA